MRRRLFIAWTLVIQGICGGTDAPTPVGPSEAIDRDPGQAGIVRTRRWLQDARLPEGISAEVVVDAPLVHRPIDVDFDAQGRLWVLEAMEEGPSSVSVRSGSPEAGARLVRLSDTDGDGRFDSRLICIELFHNPTSILVQESGIYVEQSDGLIWLEDSDDDGIPETRSQVFTVRLDADRSPVAARAPDQGWNGAMFANIDHWIHSPRLRVRIKPVPGRPRHWVHQQSTDPDGSTLCADESGRLIHSHLETGVWVEPVPLHFLHRNPNHRPQAPEAWRSRIGHDAAGPSGSPDDPSTAGKRSLGGSRSPSRIGSAGGLVYRGDRLPSAYHGALFVCDPERGVIRRHRARNGEEDPASPAVGAGSVFMALERGRFTPIRVRNGPDGSLYVVDRADDPVVDSKPPSRSAAGTTSSVIRSRATSKGRILRVLGNDEGVEPARVANAAQPWEVAARFTSARGFWQDWAQRRWVEEASPASTRILAQWVSDHQRLVGNQDSTPASVRLRALWALEGQGRISAKILSNALEDPEPRVRSAALQILAEHPPGPVKDEAMAWVLQRSAAFPAATIPSLLICLGSAATPRTEALMRSILLSSRPSEWLEDAAISGLANRELRFLGQLVADPRCGAPQVTHARLFRLLGECLHQSGNPGEIDQARGLVQGLPRTDWRVLALNEGLLGPAAGRRTSADPPHPARAGPTDR